VALAGAALTMVVSACGGPTGSPGPAATISSPGVARLTVSSLELQSGRFPTDETCSGANHAPNVEWSGVSADAGAIALELVDHDAPGGSFTHWLVFVDNAGIPGRLMSSANNTVQGSNSFGRVGYGGPCPPAGQTHHYHLVVTALSRPLGTAGAGLKAGFSRAQLEAAIQADHIIARGELVATYSR